MASATAGDRGRVLLAYSGGLDTSCILAWLVEQGYSVVAFLADVGQDEDFEAAKVKAMHAGASKVIIEDLKRDFVENYVFPTIQANCLYEGVYMLGTSIARPCIAKRQIELARQEQCAFVSHGCTGKGNDQVRFELTYYSLEPSIQVIAPWRLKEFYTRFGGRSDLLKYAAEKKIPVTQTAEKPWSTDENMFHISYEAGMLEDPNVAPHDDMYKLTVNPEKVEIPADRIRIFFKDGRPTKVVNLLDKTEKTDSVELFMYLNKLARQQGIGRIDIVENRFVGIKSRGCYETPGGTVLRTAHMDIEGVVLDREVRRLRDMLAVRFSEIIYNGFWFSPEQEFIMAGVRQSQQGVDGSVELKLTRGNVYVMARESPNSLYDSNLASMDIFHGGRGTAEGGQGQRFFAEFNPSDSDGFIKINSVRLRAYHVRRLYQEHREKTQKHDAPGTQ